MADTLPREKRPTPEEISQIRAHAESWAHVVWLCDMFPEQQEGGDPNTGARRTTGPDKSPPVSASALGRAIELDEIQWAALQKILDNPPAPNEALKKLFRDYKAALASPSSSLVLETTPKERADAENFLTKELAKADPDWPDFAVSSLHITRVQAFLRDHATLQSEVSRLAAELDRCKALDNSRSVEAQEITREFVRLQAAEVSRLTGELAEAEKWKHDVTKAWEAGEAKAIAEAEAKAREEERETDARWHDREAREWRAAGQHPAADPQRCLVIVETHEASAAFIRARSQS